MLVTTSLLRPSHLRNVSPNGSSSPNFGVTLSRIWLPVETGIWNWQFCKNNAVNTVSQPTISRWAILQPAGHTRAPEPHAKAKRGWNLYTAGQAMTTRLRCLRTKMTRLWLQNVSVNAPDAFTVRDEFDKFCSLGVIFRTVRRQHYRTTTMMVHFCHVSCSVDCFRVRLGWGVGEGESGLLPPGQFPPDNCPLPIPPDNCHRAHLTRNYFCFCLGTRSLSAFSVRPWVHFQGWVQLELDYIRLPLMY